jgi:hypothetical protein
MSWQPGLEFRQQTYVFNVLQKHQYDVSGGHFTVWLGRTEAAGAGVR